MNEEDDDPIFLNAPGDDDLVMEEDDEIQDMIMRLKQNVPQDPMLEDLALDDPSSFFSSLDSIVRNSQTIIENKADSILQAQKNNVIRIQNPTNDGEIVFFAGGLIIGAILGIILAQVIKKTHMKK